MSGKRNKRLRKEARKEFDFSNLNIQTTKEVDGQPVASRVFYTGYKRLYRDSKRRPNG